MKIIDGEEFYKAQLGIAPIWFNPNDNIVLPRCGIFGDFLLYVSIMIYQVTNYLIESAGGDGFNFVIKIKE